MQITRWMWAFGVPALIAGCATGTNDSKTSKAADQPLQITAGTRISGEGILE